MKQGISFVQRVCGGGDDLQYLLVQSALRNVPLIIFKRRAFIVRCSPAGLGMATPPALRGLCASAAPDKLRRPTRHPELVLDRWSRQLLSREASVTPPCLSGQQNPASRAKVPEVPPNEATRRRHAADRSVFSRWICQNMSQHVTLRSVGSKFWTESNGLPKCLLMLSSEAEATRRLQMMP